MLCAQEHCHAETGLGFLVPLKGNDSTQRHSKQLCVKSLGKFHLWVLMVGCPHTFEHKCCVGFLFFFGGGDTELLIFFLLTSGTETLTNQDSSRW